MEDIEKLRHQLEHWAEHNDGHIASYKQWAEKAGRLDRADIAAVLQQLASDSEKLNGLLRRALELAGPHAGDDGHHHHKHDHKH